MSTINIPAWTTDALRGMVASANPKGRFENELRQVVAELKRRGEDFADCISPETQPWFDALDATEPTICGEYSTSWLIDRPDTIRCERYDRVARAWTIYDVTFAPGYLAHPRSRDRVQEGLSNAWMTGDVVGVANWMARHAIGRPVLSKVAR